MACVMDTEVIRPVAMPLSCAASSSVRYAVPSGPTAMWRLLVLRPVASAVPPAAESVTKELSEWVVIMADTGMLFMARW